MNRLAARDPNRRRLPHLPCFESDNLSIIQYVTCNVAKRRRSLATSEAHQLLVSAWRGANHWLIGRYVIMPDHLHFFARPASFRLRRSSVGWNSGARDSQERGRTPARSRSGKKISLIANSEAAKATARNGTILSKIPCEPAWSNPQAIGRIKEN